MASNKLIRPLKIGSVLIENNLILAPLAGYTDLAFRRLAKDFGVGLTVTEMISVRGLVRENKKTATLLALAPNEKPSCVQLFGSLPSEFTDALSLECLDGFDIVDINMGCPMPKVTKNGDGSALLSDIKKASEIISACAKTGKNITVKVRLGIDDNTNALEFCKMVQDSGAKMLTVHGRTAKELYSGKADWDTIGKIANTLKIPVIGNGDISSVDDINNALSNYGVSGVMIGRGAIGNAGLFGLALDKKELPLKEIILKHIDYSMEYYSEQYTVCNMRKHIAYYLKGLNGSKAIKDKVNKIDTVKNLKAMIKQM